MYPLDFRGGAPIYSQEWEQAISLDEIVGPIILVAGNKCIANLDLEDFEGEPTNVKQVLIATWINDKITLKDVHGIYLEFLKNEWVFKSGAVSPAGLLSVEEDPKEGWSFYSHGNLLKVSNHSKFRIFIKFQNIEVEAPSISDLQIKAGKALSEAEVLRLYKALDRGKLHQELVEMQNTTRF